MTTQELIDHVNQAIETATRHQSWIDESILHVRGFSTGVMRRFFSNLVHMPKADPVYLEVGLYCGGTACAAINNSPTLHFYGVENFSQPFGNDNVPEELKANIEKYKHGARSVTLIDCDCFKVNLKDITLPVDVFFFDGEHSFESQRDALPYYFDAMADTFVFVVDDFAWDLTKLGTREGLSILKDKVKIEREWILSDGVPDGGQWHNDVAVYVLSKIKK